MTRTVLVSDIRLRACVRLTMWVVALWCLLIPLGKAVAADFSVTGINQLSEVRYTRTLFDYTYNINVSNAGPARTNVVATVTSSAASTTVLQGKVALGNVAANASFTSTATFTIRQDRTVAFNPADLHWTFTYDLPAAPPVLAPIPPQSVVAQSTLTLQLQGSDPSGKSLTYSYSPPLANASLGSSTGLFSFTPADSQVGTTSVTFTVSNGQLSASQTTPITVTGRFKPPVITSAPVTSVQASSPYAYTVVASDPQGDKLTYALTTSPTGMSINPSTGVISWTPGTTQVGPASVVVQVTNQHQLSASQSFSITVTAGAGPTLLPVSDSTVIVGNTLRLQLVASSPQGAKLSYSFTPAIANASISAAGLFTFTPVSSQIGDISATFKVTDGVTPAQAPALIHVRAPNKPPVITSKPPTTATEGSAYAYQVQATDPQSEALTYALVTAPQGMSIDRSSGLIHWTPAAGQFGSRQVDVQVTNTLGLSADQTYTIIVSAAADRIPPIVNVQAPAAAFINTTVTAMATAADNVGVTRLSWFVNDVKVADQTAPPFSIQYTEPANAGQTLKFRAVAFDAAGNSGSANAVTTATTSPDTTPPIVAALLLPPTAAPGEIVTVHADVTDDRAVASVAFTSGGIPIGTAVNLPYEVQFSVPAGAAVGSKIVINASAVDTSGNQATAQGSLTVVATPSTAAPAAVTVSAPATATVGEAIQVTGTAVDPQGVLKIVFLVDGVPFAESAQAPYKTSFPVPADASVGRQYSFVAKAIDFGGRSTSSDPAVTEVVSTQQGTIGGAVYDDSIGQPLAGVTVTVLSGSNSPPSPAVTATTDALGRYQLQAAEGSANLSFNFAGFTTAYRKIPVSGGTLNVAPDARLTPLAPGTQVNPLAASQIAAADGTLVQVDAGSIATADTLTLTALSGQGVSAPLPLGWAPVVAYELAPVSKSSFAPFHVTVKALSGTNDIAVLWDVASQQWLRVDTTSTGSVTTFNVPGGGAFAIARPDVKPQAPAVPSSGQPLTGVTPAAIPASATAQILPSPDVLFLQPGAKSAVAAALNSTATLPSGTVIKVDFSEDYEKTDNTRLIPPGNTQDMLLYQTTAGFKAGFIASPSQIFDPSLLRTGLIKLAAHTATNDGSAVIGSAGGTVSAADGASLVIPNGAFRDPTAVRVRTLTGVPASVAGDSRFTFVGGVSVDLAGSTPGAPLGLTLSVGSSITNASQLLWVRPVSSGNNNALLLVGLVSLANGKATLSDGGTGLPVPLATAEGPYYLLQSSQAFGFVTGRVLGVSSQAIVAVAGIPVVGQATKVSNTYAVLGYTGALTVSATESTTGSVASAAVNLAQVGQAVVKDLALQTAAFSVASVLPANGSANAATASSVVVQFTQAVDATTITTASVSVTGPSGAVAGSLNVSADKLRVSFTPVVPMASGTSYHLNVATTVASAAGQHLSAFASSFSTAAVASSVGDIDPGNVTAGIPTNGTSIVTGGPGAAPPGAIVTVVDVTTGATTSVVAGNDGSFRIAARVGLADHIRLSIQTSSGLVTSIDPFRFSGSGGQVVVGPEGAVISGPGGAGAIIGQDIVPAGTVASVVALSPSSLTAATVPTGAIVAGGIKLDIGTVSALQEVTISIPLPAGLSITSDQMIVVVRDGVFAGKQGVTLVNIAKVVNGRISTASPPFQGARVSGNYYFLVLQQASYDLLQVKIDALNAYIAAAIQPALFWYYAITDSVPSAIIIAPHNRPFTLTMLDEQANVIASHIVPPLASGRAQYSTLELSANTGGMHLIDSYPPVPTDPLVPTAGVGIDERIVLSFDRQLSSDAATLLHVYKYDCSKQNDPGASVSGSIQVNTQAQSNGTTTLQGARVVFTPTRRMSVNSCYRVDPSALCAFGDYDGGTCQKPPAIAALRFQTFAPRPLGDIGPINTPNDVASLSSSRIGVASGNFGGPNDTDGYLMFDAPIPVTSMRPLPPDTPFTLVSTQHGHVGQVGKAYAIQPVPNSLVLDQANTKLGDAFLAVGGSATDYGALRVLQAGQTSLGQKGIRLLSTNLSVLLSGSTTPGVPPYGGIPTAVALLGSDSAYVATVGVGIQALHISDTIQSAKQKLPATASCFGSDISGKCQGTALDTVSAVNTIGTVVVAGDLKNLYTFRADLTPIGSTPLAIPARKIVTALGMVTESGDRSAPTTQQEDLAFVAGPQNDLYIVQFPDNAATGQSATPPVVLSQLVMPGRIWDLAVNPTSRLVYAALDDGRVQVVDVSRPDEGSPFGKLVDANKDGVDDRLIGTISVPGDTTLACLKTTSGGFGLVGYGCDRVAGSVKVFLLEPDTVTACDSASLQADRAARDTQRAQILAEIKRRNGDLYKRIVNNVEPAARELYAIYEDIKETVENGIAASTGNPIAIYKYLKGVLALPDKIAEHKQKILELEAVVVDLLDLKKAIDDLKNQYRALAASASMCSGNMSPLTDDPDFASEIQFAEDMADYLNKLQSDLEKMQAYDDQMLDFISGRSDTLPSVPVLSMPTLPVPPTAPPVSTPVPPVTSPVPVPNPG